MSKSVTAAKPGKSTAEDIRKARLAEQLRANLQKRKAQARARRSGEEDQRDGLSDTAANPADK